MLAPTCWTSGSIIRAATVCEMNVATTKMRPVNDMRTPYRLKSPTRSVIALAIVCKRPDEVTACPRQRPPEARMMMVQRKLLKSSLVRIPVPKNNTSGIMAITPMSPRVVSSSWLTHQRMIVKRVTRVMNHCTPENLSLTGRMGTIVVPRPGWKVTRRRIQIPMMQMMQTGRAMKNQVPQLMAGFMFWRAMMFCGDAIGDAAPPTLEARAMPRIRALENRESVGRFRSIGC